MTVYAQHGYGKSDKLSVGLDTGAIGGVVFSAKDEKPDALVSCIQQLRDSKPDARLMFDPQFQLCMYNPAKSRYLSQYDYYAPGRRPSDFVGARKLQKFVRLTLDAQIPLAVDSLVAPTVHVDEFGDREHQIALNLAAESLEYHSGLAGEDRPLFLSFVIGEHAFSRRGGVDEFLDQVTAWDIEGIYLVIARAEPGYTQRFDANRLAHIMYAAHVLGYLNEIEVVCGYTDIHGILLRTAGAAGFATGWSQGCRRYHRGSFLVRKGGGRRPRLRYCSASLMQSIFLGELEQVHDIDMMPSVLSGTPCDDVILEAQSPEDANWDVPTAIRQHWEALSALDDAIDDDLETDLDNLSANIETAQALYAELQEAGVAFDRPTRDDHLDDWADALRIFRDRVGF